MQTDGVSLSLSVKDRGTSFFFSRASAFAMSRSMPSYLRMSAQSRNVQFG